VQAITGRQATQTQLTAPSTAVAGVPTRLTAHVTPAPDLGEGIVTFTGDGKPITGCSGVRVTSSGEATCDFVSADTGNVTVQATFSGDDALEPSNSSDHSIAVAIAWASTMTATVTDVA